jgi:hypothetical protein
MLNCNPSRVLAPPVCMQPGAQPLSPVSQDLQDAHQPSVSLAHVDPHQRCTAQRTPLGF